MVDRCGPSGLWGTAAFILNFVPILGPISGVIIFLFAGLLTIASTWQALLPAMLYGAIHLIEGETVTPIFLRNDLHLIRFLSSWPSRFGIGSGAFPARSSRRQFSRSPKLSAIECGRSRLSAIFSRVEDVSTTQSAMLGRLPMGFPPSSLDERSRQNRKRPIMSRYVFGAEL